MKALVDSNVFLALVVALHPHHLRSVQWFDEITEEQSVYFCRPTQNTFLRLLTTRAILGPYVCSNDEAIRIYQTLRSDSRIGLLSEEPPNLERLWLEFARSGEVAPKRWMDAYLAAWSRAAGMRFTTFDQGFKSFVGLNLQLLR
jgi:uncharacterized protein